MFVLLNPDMILILLWFSKRRSLTCKSGKCGMLFSFFPFKSQSCLVLTVYIRGLSWLLGDRWGVQGEDRTQGELLFLFMPHSLRTHWKVHITSFFKGSVRVIYNLLCFFLPYNFPLLEITERWLIPQHFYSVQHLNCILKHTGLGALVKVSATP